MLIKRRDFIKTAALGGMAMGLGSSFLASTSHMLTLSFDDGFKKSFYKIAEIYEQYGLHACLNVIGSGHLPSFQAPDDYITSEILGDFEDWNKLQSRGHEIMPHTWKHANLTRLPFEEATALIDKCLDYFTEHLEGFKTKNAVFNFAFNASTPALENYLLSKVRAVRTMGDTPYNQIPITPEPVVLGCRLYGPGNIDDWVDQQINDFLASKGGWLLLNTHGLDDEGWGPMSGDYLDQLLQRLTRMKHLQILPAGEVLKRSV